MEKTLAICHDLKLGKFMLDKTNKDKLTLK